MLTDVGGTPVVQSTGGGWGNGDGGGLVSLLVLIALLGGNGFNNHNNHNNGGHAGLTNEFLYTNLNTNTQAGFSNLEGQINYSNLNNGINGIEKAVLAQTTQIGTAIAGQTTQMNNGFYAINDTVKDGNYALNNTIKDGNYALNTSIKDGFCHTNFNIERSSNAIIQNQTVQTQRIIDWLSCNELKEANQKIYEKDQLLSEQRIIGAMKPQAPIPSYYVPSPYASYNNCEPRRFDNCSDFR